MTTFVDRVVLHCAAGDGGHGCTSIRREKFKPLGGPDGANGGNGGNVVLVVESGLTTLLEYHHRPHRKAGHGGPGQGSMRNGANGEDVVLPVPAGTVVYSMDGEELADLVVPGQRYVIAQGGRGGLGNAALASARRKAPGFHLLGEPGQTADVVLELKSIADVALVGFPSAGKSSLISAVSAAKPKVADYPFTTLVPHLGVVSAGDTVFTIADVPGLIPGASQGKGLGHEFLRHIERCAVIVHVLDCATLESDRDPLVDLEIIEGELAAYGGLEDRPRIVALNKIDVPDGKTLADMVAPILAEKGLRTFEISAVSHEGLRPFTFALAEMVKAARLAAGPYEEPRIILTPRPTREVGFSVEVEDGAFRVLGERPQRWVKQTDFNNQEAVGYLADRLARLGVETELVKKGAKPGATVIIGPGENAVVFDWEPTLEAGAGRGASPRGSDVRLEGR